ncbi:PLP-dependent aminotransferase family protein [Pendulispora albinea]|uniref:PLP-dependent aminotransferase family protein n=1 Tax=Pendulispora albinea TaxID=2741071 RepID=A0ABZ2MAJ4_9BACT
MARPWVFPVALDAASATPLFLQIAQAIVADIRRGRLRPGAVLPGSRSLARTLGVHRNTVLASYRDLQDGGWIVSTQRSLRVSEALAFSASSPAASSAASWSAASSVASSRGVSSRGVSSSGASSSGVSSPTGASSKAPVRARTNGAPGFDLERAVLSQDLAELGARAMLPGSGGPDLRLLPVDLLARGFRRALRAKGGSALAYGTRQGDVRLRRALAELLSDARGLLANEDDVLVTSGSQMALDLVARALVRPGDAVAVENPGYPPAWDAFRLAGAELVPVAVDEGGMRVDALEALANERPLRIVYTTPHHQFPTTVTMAPARRMALLALARARRIAIVEDDYDFEFHYAGRPLWPLASGDDAGVVIYLGTLSKILAPGVRLGFVTGPRPLIEELAVRRSRLDRGNPAMDRAICELIEDGLLQRHARKMRRIYEARRDALVGALRRDLDGVVSFDVPAGGMTLWLRVTPEIDVDLWAQRAVAHEASFLTGRAFDFHARPRPTLRMGFANRDERELRDIVRRMRAALGGASSRASVAPATS